MQRDTNHAAISRLYPLVLLPICHEHPTRSTTPGAGRVPGGHLGGRQRFPRHPICANEGMA